MNEVTIIGRIATDIELRTTQNGIAHASFKVAVDRKYKGQDGKKISDFLQVAAWRQSAEFVSKYGNKGDRVAVHGSIQSRSYDAQDGTKRYITEIVSDNIELFGSSKREGESGAGGNNTASKAKATSANDGFVEVDETDDLPF